MIWLDLIQSAIQLPEYWGLIKKDIYSNIKDRDALESFFECITHCSINSEGVACATACYTKHLKSIESS